MTLPMWYWSAKSNLIYSNSGAKTRATLPTDYKAIADNPERLDGATQK
jgi:hypothetical protein